MLNLPVDHIQRLAQVPFNVEAHVRAQVVQINPEFHQDLFGSHLKQDGLLKPALYVEGCVIVERCLVGFDQPAR